MEAPNICEQFRFVGVECLAPVSNGRTKAKTRISLPPRTVACINFTKLLAVWSLIITFWAFSLKRLTGLLAKHTPALAWIQKCRLVLNSSISPSKGSQTSF